jgi:hypothetical protein
MVFTEIDEDRLYKHLIFDELETSRFSWLNKWGAQQHRKWFIGFGSRLKGRTMDITKQFVLDIKTVLCFRNIVQLENKTSPLFLIYFHVARYNWGD